MAKRATRRWLFLHVLAVILVMPSLNVVAGGVGDADSTTVGTVAGIPLNDACGDAFSISGDGPFEFDNTLASEEGPTHDACNFDNQPEIVNDVWYCWTAPEEACSTDVEVRTCFQTEVDTKIAVYVGCSCPPPDFQLRACADADCGFQSQAFFMPVPGVQYLIRVGTYVSADGGPGTFTVTCPGPPENDDCADAELISGLGDFLFDNTAATTDGPPHTACTFQQRDQIERDAWFCWESPCDETVFVETCGGTSLDSKLAVYEGCACPVSDGNLLACNDDSCAFQSRAYFEASAGQNYLIRLGKPPNVDGDPETDEPGGAGVVRFSCGKSNCPGDGDCLTATSTPGCDDAECCEATCRLDPFCCDDQWDDVCVEEAQGYCMGGFDVCAPGSGACTEANLQPGCDDPDCCNAVCEIDSFCCRSEWDERCVDLEAVTCFSVCGSGSGDCMVANGSPGCENAACCAEVCPRDRVCCDPDREWDIRCASFAAVHCVDLQNCPIGEVILIEPPDGLVDARLPHGIDGSGKLGVRTFVFEGPPRIDRGCFDFCETGIQGFANQVVGFVESPIDSTTSSYTLSLDRPITTGAVTTITYTADDMSTSTSRLLSHPGNVNGDTIASADDVDSVMAVLDGVDIGANAPWGDHSADLDHSGVVNSPDILALIDVLNGAGVLDPWMGTPRPSTDGICP